MFRALFSFFHTPKEELVVISKRQIENTEPEMNDEESSSDEEALNDSRDDLNIRDSNDRPKRKTSLMTPHINSYPNLGNQSPPAAHFVENLLLGDVIHQQQVARKHQQHFKEPPKKREKIVRTRRSEAIFSTSPQFIEVPIVRGELEAKVIRLCSHCGKEVGAQFRERLGRIYCIPDYEALFLPKCAACKLPVIGGIRALDTQTWHKGCFVCRVCKGAIFSPSYFTDDYNNYPFCDNCGPKIVRCTICNKRVDPLLVDSSRCCNYCKIQIRNSGNVNMTNSGSLMQGTPPKPGFSLRDSMETENKNPGYRYSTSPIRRSLTSSNQITVL